MAKKMTENMQIQQHGPMPKQERDSSTEEAAVEELADEMVLLLRLLLLLLASEDPLLRALETLERGCLERTLRLLPGATLEAGEKRALPCEMGLASVGFFDLLEDFCFFFFLLDDKVLFFLTLLLLFLVGLR